MLDRGPDGKKRRPGWAGRGWDMIAGQCVGQLAGATIAFLETYNTIWVQANGK